MFSPGREARPGAKGCDPFGIVSRMARSHLQQRNKIESCSAEEDAVEMYWYANCVTRRLVEGREVPGVYFPAFIHNGDYYLTSIVAYQDGLVECWGLVTFAEFVQKVREGWVVTSVPEGATV